MRPALVVLPVLLVPAFPVCAQPTNLLDDPGFERRDYWSLASWEAGEYDSAYVATSRSGDQAVRLTGLTRAEGTRLNYVCYTPPIDVRGGAEYFFTVYYRTDGDPRPSISYITWKEPFANAQWKTPKADYRSKMLPPADGWRLAHWRFRVALDAVQMAILVRLGEVGSVWYDDACLVECGQVDIQATTLGEVVGLPDSRVLRATLTVADSARPFRWKARLVRSDGGRVLGESEGTAATAEVNVVLPYEADEGDEVTALLLDARTNALIEAHDFTVPPMVRLTLLSPRYRNSIYTSRHLKRVRLRLDVNASKQVLRRLKYAGPILAGLGDAPKLPPPSRAITSPRMTLSIRAAAIPRGQHRIIVAVSGSAPLEVPVRKVPPSPSGHEVIIGDDNQLLVDGKRVFPAGFYGPAVGTMRPIADAGYNVVLTYASDPQTCREWLDDCRNLGLLGIVSVGRRYVERPDDENLRADIEVVKDHPALLGYYLIDEPSPAREGQSPDDLKRHYRKFCEIDPYHPTMMCLNVPGYYEQYAPATDIIMVDPYPLVKSPRPLTWVSDCVDDARRACRDQKPVYAVPQAFGWDVIEGIPDPERYRTPTPAQERAMTYLALAHGVKGVIYYCYHVYTGYDAAKKEAGGWPYILGGYLPDKQPVLWGELARLGREMRQLGPRLLATPAQTHVFDGLHLGTFGPTRRQTVIVVNPTDVAVQMPTTLHLPRDATLLFGENVPSDAAIAPLSTRVYVSAAAKKGTEPFSQQNAVYSTCGPMVEKGSVSFFAVHPYSAEVLRFQGPTALRIRSRHRATDAVDRPGH
ncbi:MAG: hypothetical protein ACE5O2_00690 [Armatimonadota bacterium]